MTKIYCLPKTPDATRLCEEFADLSLVWEK